MIKLLCPNQHVHCPSLVWQAKFPVRFKNFKLSRFLALLVLETTFAASNFGILTAAIFPVTGDLSHSYTRGNKTEYNSR